MKVAALEKPLGMRQVLTVKELMGMSPPVQESASLRRKGDKEKIQFVKKQFSTVPAQVLTEGMHLFNNQDMSHYRK